MRILHTSDWHVGKALRGRDRSDEHAAVLNEITSIARDRAVDLVIVAGDLFDSAAPTPEAERIVYRALLDLEAVAPVVVVSGNHDNDRRLAAVEPLLRLGRITTRAMLAKPDAGGVIEVAGARIAMLPWISQRHIVRAAELMAMDPDQHAGMFAERLADIVRTLTFGFGSDTVNVIAGHAMISGGMLGGGERLAHTIFEYCLSATAFPASAHYVALGHLHRAQQLGNQPPVWYCGSPLQLDFGEVDDAKCVLIAEATPATPAAVEQVRLTAGRKLVTIRGTLDQLRAQADTGDESWLKVFIQEEARAGLADDVRELFGERCVDVVIDVHADREMGIEPRGHEGRSPGELFREYLGEKKAQDERVMALFDQLLEEELGKESDAPAPA